MCIRDRGLVDALARRNLELACPYFQPSVQALCRRAFKTPDPSVGTFKNFALGYSVVDGKQALVGWTGTSCVPNEKPTCVSNKNPAAVFSSGRKFKTLWAQAVAAAVSNGQANDYGPIPCVKVGSRWYDYLPLN